MDLFCAEEHGKAQKLLLDLISKMLDSGVVERKLHAFNLLFNIAVHSNLITEVSPAEIDEKKGLYLESLGFFYLISAFIEKKKSSYQSACCNSARTPLYSIEGDA